MGRGKERERDQGDLAKNLGEKDEGMQTVVGNRHQTVVGNRHQTVVGNRHQTGKLTAVALFYGSLMCHLRHKED